MFNSIKSTLLATACMCSFSTIHAAFPSDTSFTYLQTLTPTIAGSPAFGDSFGGAVKLNGPFLFVGAPLAQPNNKTISGAVYVYKSVIDPQNPDQTIWQNSQIITTDGANDNLSAMKIESYNDWLFVSAVGTPIGPNAAFPDTVQNQTFSGCVLIYRFDATSGQWQLWQRLDKYVPGLEKLANIDPQALNPANNPFAYQQGANFGFQMSLDAENGDLLVSALYQQQSDQDGSPLLNSGSVFAFQLNQDTNTWNLIQELKNPDGVSENDAFGSAVAVKNGLALISSAPSVLGPKPVNSAVYLFSRQASGWNFQQKIIGDQTDPALVPLNSLSPLYNYPSGITSIGDAFGSSLALDNSWAMIGAGFECGDMTAKWPFSGSVYFYQINRTPDSGAELSFTQKVSSDDSTSSAFGLHRVEFFNGMAFIQDSMRSGPNGAPRQGGVVVYTLQNNSWTQANTVYDPDGKAFDFFGSSFTVNNLFFIGGCNLFTGAYILNSHINVPPLAPLPPFGDPLAVGKAVLFQSNFIDN
jgi:hypothetical protein